jgi:tetratricopeptide (TPR) repeat protein
VLDGSEDDTTRIKLSMRIAKLYERYMPDTAMFYYQSVVDTSIFRSQEFLQSEILSKKGRHTYNTNSMYLLGLLYTYRGEYPVSSDLWSKSLKIFEELNDNYGVSKCLNGLGNLAWNQGNYPEAIEYL